MTSWYYIDAWDWVLDGGRYVWNRMYSSGVFQSSDLNLVESKRHVGFQRLKTAQGVVRCFIWDPTASSWSVCPETFGA